MEETAREDYDSPWKEIIERFFERFMAFYFRRAHRLIAWEQGFEFLDKNHAQSRARLNRAAARWINSFASA